MTHILVILQTIFLRILDRLEFSTVYRFPWLFLAIAAAFCCTKDKEEKILAGPSSWWALSEVLNVT